jgi:putative peptidoglycan lipid II flippase
VEVRERSGPGAAARLLASATKALLAVTAILAALLALFAPVWIAWLAAGFGGPKAALTVSLLRVMAPVAIFGGVASVWRSILNTSEHFVLAATVPVVTPLSIMIWMFAGAQTLGIYAVALGTVSGAALELALVAGGLRATGLPLGLAWHGIDPALAQVFRQSAPMLGVMLLMGSSGIVSRSMAAALGLGSVSVFDYGVRLVAFFTAMGPAVVSTAVFPHFARMAAQSDWPALRHSLKTLLSTLLLGSIPVTVALVLFSPPLVRAFLQRGAFSGADTQVVAQVQRLSLLQIPFILLAAPIARLMCSLKANNVLLRAAVIYLTASVALTYVLRRIMGLPGIALATAMVAAIYFFYLWFVLQSRLKSREKQSAVEAGVQA